MKICIMGPVPSKTVYGGVAQFDRAMGEGFMRNDCEVILCSEQPACEVKVDFTYRTIGYTNVNRVMREEKPNIIISSLAYAKYYPFIHYRCIKTYFLHGFFNIGHYGLIKALLGWLFQKVIVKRCDRIYANSDYTRIINSDIMGLRVDKTALIGVSEQLIEQAQREEMLFAKNNRKLIFAGRLTGGKKVSVAVQAVRELHEEGFEFLFEVIGDGPDMSRIKQMAFDDPQICFLGRLTQEDLFEKERDAEIFISLNPSEPYGMVFIEALMAGCKIICPQTGGHIEPLGDYSDRVIQVNPMEVVSVKEGIKSAFLLRPKPLNTKTFKTHFSYDRTAAVILQDLKEMLN